MSSTKLDSLVLYACRSLLPSSLAKRWPARLCGGHLLTFDPAALDTDGALVALEENSPEELSLGDGPSIDTVDAWNSETDLEDRFVADLLRTALHEGTRGRRRKEAVATCPVDETAYCEPVRYKKAVVEHCIRELSLHWPFIEVSALKQMVDRIMSRSPSGDELMRDQELRPVDLLAGGILCFSSSPVNMIAACDAAFVRHTPPVGTRREALVRAVEYLTARDADEGFVLPRANSRPFAVASIAAGEEIIPHTLKPWFVADAIEAEGRAIWHQVKKLAASR